MQEVKVFLLEVFRNDRHLRNKVTGVRVTSLSFLYGVQLPEHFTYPNTPSVPACLDNWLPTVCVLLRMLGETMGEMQGVSLPFIWETLKYEWKDTTLL